MRAKTPAVVIAVTNNKGGVGKTITTQDLSAALADKGKNVCMIDFDSQHNLTNRCKNEQRAEELEELLSKGGSIENYLRNSKLEILPFKIKENLFLIPSTIELAQYSTSLYQLSPSESPSEVLKRFCNDMREVFDFIIIDSEPGMGALMVNATKAADLIIIPINCLDALGGASEGVFGIMDQNNLQTPYFFLQTMYEHRLKSSRDIRSQLIAEERSNTFHTYIKRNEYLNSAGNYGLDIFEYAPKSGGAGDYKDLASEVLSIIKNRK